MLGDFEANEHVRLILLPKFAIGYRSSSGSIWAETAIDKPQSGSHTIRFVLDGVGPVRHGMHVLGAMPEGVPPIGIDNEDI